MASWTTFSANKKLGEIMSYRISDLIEKLIKIEEDGVELYTSIEKQFQESFSQISIVAKILANQEKKHILYYQELMKNIEEEMNCEIDFFLYDKAAKQLFEFRNHIHMYKLDDVKGLIHFAVDLEKKNIGLLLDIQGKLFEKLEDVSDEVYKVLTKIIEEEKQHENMLEKFK